MIRTAHRALSVTVFQSRKAITGLMIMGLPRTVAMATKATPAPGETRAMKGLAPDTMYTAALTALRATRGTWVVMAARRVLAQTGAVIHRNVLIFPATILIAAWATRAKQAEAGTAQTSTARTATKAIPTATAAIWASTPTPTCTAPITKEDFRVLALSTGTASRKTTTQETHTKAGTRANMGTATAPEEITVRETAILGVLIARIIRHLTSVLAVAASPAAATATTMPAIFKAETANALSGTTEKITTTSIKQA